MYLGGPRGVAGGENGVGIEKEGSLYSARGVTIIAGLSRL